MAIHPKARQEIDTYIASLDGFAKPVCRKLRELIHKADPDIVEDWKWGPNFNHDGMVCGFGAFKAHVSFAFFQGAAMKDPKKLLIACSEDNARNRTMKFSSVDDIDERAIVAYVKEAVALNVKGIKAPARRAAIPMQPDLKKALAGNAKARAFWDGLTPGYQRDYLDWVTQAKQEATRKERVATTVQWCSKGRTRNWKYEKK